MKTTLSTIKDVILALTTALLCLYPSYSMALNEAPTKSFNDWKNERISHAKNQLQQSEQKLRQIKLNKSNTKQIQSLEAQVSQNQWALEVAQDLTTTDYLMLYLSSQNNPNKYDLAAAKMSKEETAKLLEAYLNTMATLQSEKNRASKLPRHADDGK